MNTLNKQITESTIVKWYQSRSKREQLLVLGSVALVFLLFLFLYLFPTVNQFRDNRVQAYESAIDELDWMKLNADQAKLRREIQNAQGGTQNSTVLFRNANVYNVDVARVDPGENGASVRVERESFDNVIRWVFSLQDEAGLNVWEMRMNKIEPGVVNMTMIIR